MSKADQIRSLAASGKEVSDIADELGIRYQHAYNVLKRSGLLASAAIRDRDAIIVKPPQKPPLPTATLTEAGFTTAARFTLRNNILTIEGNVPKDVGVYAFAKDGMCLYVGVATMGLAKRLYFYRKPSVTQRTSLRIHGLLKAELVAVPAVDILTAIPDDRDWNGLPVHGSAGLELGLIKKFALPWNMRSAR